MHRDTVTQVALTSYVTCPPTRTWRSFVTGQADGHPPILCSTNFLITSSLDGHLKFWKKQTSGIEFVKHYRTHLGPILGLGVSHDGKTLASIGADQGGKTVQDLVVKGSVKVFDVENFGKSVVRLIELVGCG